MILHKLISTCLGIGYIRKGGGTVAAVATCLVWYFCMTEAGGNSNFLIPGIITILLYAIGIWSGNKVESEWGKDSYRVVIDEAAGMCTTLLFIAPNKYYILIGLVLFRFFDIAKPLYIRRMENFKGGWGVMLDDMLAGIYANIVLQLIVKFI
ncbi:phosphatidylglycerophosphatase A [Chitinophagaceae bacterium LWZ2-11]